MPPFAPIGWCEYRTLNLAKDALNGARQGRSAVDLRLESPKIFSIDEGKKASQCAATPGVGIKQTSQDVDNLRGRNVQCASENNSEAWERGKVR